MNARKLLIVWALIIFTVGNLDCSSETDSNDVNLIITTTTKNESTPTNTSTWSSTTTTQSSLSSTTISPEVSSTSSPNFEKNQTNTTILGILSPSKEIYYQCLNDYQNEMISKFNEYALTNKLPALKASEKFHASALVHAKLYSSLESFDSDFNYFAKTLENFSQIGLSETNYQLNTCKELARVNIQGYFKNNRLHWELPLEIGCGVEISDAKTSYGVCHISPPVSEIDDSKASTTDTSSNWSSKSDKIQSNTTIYGNDMDYSNDEGTLTPKEKLYIRCLEDFESELISQLNEYAVTKKHPEVEASQKFSSSAIVHAKVYAFVDSVNSDFNFFAERSENLSQIAFIEKHSKLTDCRELARVSIKDYFSSKSLHWEHPLRIGCGVEISHTKSTYGVCHMSPPVRETNRSTTSTISSTIWSSKAKKQVYNLY